MCELYLHSADRPTTRHPWLPEFLARSQKPYDNPDGWGVAFHVGDDAQLFHQPEPAHESELARFVETHAYAVKTVVGHLRKASMGDVMLANTQPLSRVVGRRRLIFAHNGSVAELKTSPEGRTYRDRALGTADSEIALLAFIDFLHGRRLQQCVADFPHFATRMAGIGPFNLIVTDGEDVLAYSDRRQHTGDPPDTIRGPGLVMQRASGSLVLSSEPLAEDTEPIPRGTALHIRGADIVSRSEALAEAA